MLENKKKFFTKDIPLYSRFDIGEFTYGKPNVVYHGGDVTLKIGKFCSIANEVVFLLEGDHRVDWVTTYPFPHIFEEFSSIKGHPCSKGDIILGNDIWIGWGATILSGVTIGDGAVIAARSVVSSDVPPYTIVGGTPAKQIKLRFNEDDIKSLLKIRWWDWPFEKIKQNMPMLLSGDIEAFISRNA